MTILYTDLTTERATSELARRRLFIPVGSVEQHGPHLPLSVDVDIAHAVAVELATRTGGLVAPAVTYAARSLPQSGGGARFPGSVFVRASTLVSVFRDVLLCFIANGARDIIAINGHYENEALLFEAFEQVHELKPDFRGVALSWWSAVPAAEIEQLFGASFPGWHAEHAGLTETSLMLYLRPDAVGPIRVDNERPPDAGVYATDLNRSNRGVLSATSGATAEAGHRLFEVICQRCQELVA